MSRLGSLDFVPVLEAPTLLPPIVAEAVALQANSSAFEVAPIDGTLSDTAAFCSAYGIRMDQSANCVILKTKKADVRGYAALVILAHTRADINGKVCTELGVKKASFAPMEEAVALSSMEFGAITPVGLPLNWPILIDSKVVEVEKVIIGGGFRNSKIAVDGKYLSLLPNARVIEGLALLKEVKE